MWAVDSAAKICFCFIDCCGGSAEVRRNRNTDLCGSGCDVVHEISFFNFRACTSLSDAWKVVFTSVAVLIETISLNAA